jgi:hypothetical protein
MKPEKKFHQICSYEAPSDTKADGTFNYSSACEILVRWEDNQTEPFNTIKSTIDYDALIFVDTALSIGGLVKLGKINDEGNIYIIISTETVPDIKGRVFCITHRLRKHA